MIHVFRNRRELCVRRKQSLSHHSLVGPYAIGFPAIIEFAFVLIRPLFENLVRAVRGSASPIHEKWFFRCGQHLKAVQQNAIYDGLDNDVLLRPGPRVLEGVALLRKCFADVAEGPDRSSN